jgi:hypothetical protein
MNLKLTKKMMLLCGALSLVACTDSDYDLSKISEDGITIGESLSGPLGSITLSTRDMVDIESLLVKRINCPETAVNGWKYGTGHIILPEEQIYQVSFQSEPVVLTSEEVEDLISVQLESGTLAIQLDLLGIVAEDAKAYVEFSVSLPDGWRIEGGKNDSTKVFSLLNDFQKGKNTFLIPVQSITPGENRQISVDIRLVLEKGASVNVTRTPAFKAFAELKDVEYTDIFARIGETSVSDTIKNVFEKGLIDLLFSGGTVELSGTGRNDVPLSLGLGLTITGANNAPVGIIMEEQQISGGATADVLKFVIKESDMTKMKQARHIVFTATTHPSGTDVHIKPDQTLTLKLGFKKEGGIAVSNF